jgi:hypothetical protein
MELTSYIEALRQELAVAAAAGGDEARELAERLVAPLDSATRLVLLDSLSAAAAEITRDLAPGSVEVRLRGRDPEFVVTPPPVPPALVAAEAVPVEAPAVPAADLEGGTARISLRLPEQLKGRVDEAALEAGLSVNAWLVRAIAAAVQPGPRPTPSDPLAGDQVTGGRYSGWVR